ncbi:sperm acrosome membrane-associated protein 6 [Lissotriton helveticus]
MVEFVPPSAADTLAVIKSLKSRSPTDPCPARVLAGIAEVVVQEVVHIIGLSFKLAIVPADWKQAKLLPLLKKAGADPALLANYRPISLLPAMAKIGEKMAFRQLNEFVESSGALHPAQSGFRAAHSTESALVEISEAGSCNRAMSGLLYYQEYKYFLASLEFAQRRTLQAVINTTLELVQKEIDKVRQETEEGPKMTGTVDVPSIITSTFDKFAPTVKQAVPCLPPCGYQKSARYLRCDTCLPSDCDVPIDCPIRDYNVGEYEKVNFRCLLHYQIEFEEGEEFVYAWKFAKNTRTQDIFYFKDIHTGDDPLLLIKPVRDYHDGTYLCEIILDEDIIARMFFYLNVTVIRFLEEHELQVMFRSILHSHDDIDQTPEEAITISVEHLLEERGFLRKRSINYIIILVALVTMAITLLAGALYHYSTDVEVE